MEGFSSVLFRFSPFSQAFQLSPIAFFASTRGSTNLDGTLGSAMLSTLSPVSGVGVVENSGSRHKNGRSGSRWPRTSHMDQSLKKEKNLGKLGLDRFLIDSSLAFCSPLVLKLLGGLSGERSQQGCSLQIFSSCGQLVSCCAMSRFR